MNRYGMLQLTTPLLYLSCTYPNERQAETASINQYDICNFERETGSNQGQLGLFMNHYVNCKTVILGFDSRCRLQILSLRSPPEIVLGGLFYIIIASNPVQQ